MRIAIDAMGGDNAPGEPVRGALEFAAAHAADQLCLVGDPEVVREVLDAASDVPPNVSTVESYGVIDMADEPVSALRRKPQASIARCVELMKRGEADALVSAGNTGATVAAAMFGLRRLAGVRRPGIATSLPTFRGYCTLIDVGANINCKPVNLFQYAVMGVAYAKLVRDCPKPRVGLLSIGEEETKGNSLVKETRRLLRDGGINFLGNVEGRDIFTGRFDVVVCEGFVGNAILKVTEGLSESLYRTLDAEVERFASEADGAASALRAALERMRRRTDYAETGGAPLLGLEGHCVICHGRSDARALGNAIGAASRMVELGINDHISAALTASVT